MEGIPYKCNLKRTSYIQTKNRVNSSQLKRVLEEGLHHDHTTDGEYHNSEIKQSLDIRKFIHGPMTNVFKKTNPVSREKAFSQP